AAKNCKCCWRLLKSSGLIPAIFEIAFFAVRNEYFLERSMDSFEKRCFIVGIELRCIELVQVPYVSPQPAWIPLDAFAFSSGFEFSFYPFKRVLVSLSHLRYRFAPRCMQCGNLGVGYETSAPMGMEKAVIAAPK